MNEPDTVAADREALRAARQRIDRYGWLLDNAIRVPGTPLRVGVDSLIGLIPGVGDIAGLLLGGAIIAQAARVGVPQPLLLRMAGNVGLDALLGVVPVLGDAADFAFKSNARNARLLREHIELLEGQLLHQDRSSLPPHSGVPRLLARGLIVATLALAGAAIWGLFRLL